MFTSVMDLLNMIFTVVFTIEMIIKLLALRAHVRFFTHLPFKVAFTTTVVDSQFRYSFLCSIISSIRGIRLTL